MRCTLTFGKGLRSKSSYLNLSCWRQIPRTTPHSPQEEETGPLGEEVQLKTSSATEDGCSYFWSVGWGGGIRTRRLIEKSLTRNASVDKRHTSASDHGSHHHRWDVTSSGRAYGGFLGEKTIWSLVIKESITSNGEPMAKYPHRPPITIPSELKLAKPQRA